MSDRTNGKPNDSDIPDSTPGVRIWPRPISEEGYIGIAGDFLELVSPHTEADPNALLMTFLAYAGNCFGRNFFTYAGADMHCGNLFVCLTGNTGSGRKGSAMAAVASFFSRGPTPPKLGHVLDGISSGEGLIYEIHDAVYRFNPKSQKLEEQEQNIPDKRLLICLSELQQALAVIRREQNTLSPILRQAWDKEKLQAPAKNSGVKATGALVSVIAGISKEELLAETELADAQNGTLNRFLFVCSHRSKLLPQAGGFSKLFRSEEWKALQQRFIDNTTNRLENGPIEIERDPDADELWGRNETPSKGMYHELSETRTGLWGSVTARAAQQVLRLALISAVINGSTKITTAHLNAGFEYWRYCDDSALHIFGSEMQETAADIMTALKAIAPGGLSRTQIHRIWANHKDSSEISRALLWLAHHGMARVEKILTSGRPVENWYAI